MTKLTSLRDYTFDASGIIRSLQLEEVAFPELTKSEKAFCDGLVGGMDLLGNLWGHLSNSRLSRFSSGYVATKYSLDNAAKCMRPPYKFAKLSPERSDRERFYQKAGNVVGLLSNVLFTLPQIYFLFRGVDHLKELDECEDCACEKLFE